MKAFDESYSKIIRGHKYKDKDNGKDNDKDKYTDKEKKESWPELFAISLLSPRDDLGLILSLIVFDLCVNLDQNH